MPSGTCRPPRAQRRRPFPAAVHARRAGRGPRALDRRFAWVAYVAFAGAAVAFYGCPIARLLHTPCPACGTTRAGPRAPARRACAPRSRSSPWRPWSSRSSARSSRGPSRSRPARENVARLFEGRVGRAIVVAFAACALAELALWITRVYGALGGPVPM